MERDLARAQAEVDARDRALQEAKAAAELARAAAKAELDAMGRALAKAEAEAEEAANLREQDMPQCNMVTMPLDGMNGLVQAIIMGLLGGGKQLPVTEALLPETAAAAEREPSAAAPQAGSAQQAAAATTGGEGEQREKSTAAATAAVPPVA